MKKYFLVLLIIPFFTQCNNEESERLKRENDSLKQMAQNRDETINDFFQTFNEIEENLELIKEKENIISMDIQGETASSSKERINNDILSIYELLLKNKAELAKLEKKMHHSNVRIREFEKMVKNLQKQLKSKDIEISNLRKEIENKNLAIENLTENIDNLTDSISNLSQENEEKTEIIEEQIELINSAYYVLGTKDELKNENIITKEGGLAGIGGTHKLKGNFNHDYFSEIDIRTLKEIPLNCKKVDILTTHPADSYEIIGEKKDYQKLVISDYDKFWSVSKYLVILIDR